MMTSHALCIVVVALPNFKLSVSPLLMGLSTLDPYDTKERTKLYKILKLLLIVPIDNQAYKI